VKNHRAPLRNVFVASLLACAGCPGTLEDPERFADGGESDGSDCPDIPSTLFATTCAKTGCHSTNDQAQGLDLQSSDVASRLVGVTSTEGAGLLIDPSNPTMSVLYTKLMMVPPFGSRMPLANTPLDAATMSCVLAWIEEAAGTAGDASASDSGSPIDTTEAGPEVEAGTSEGGGPAADAGVSRDAGTVDAGVRDTGSGVDASVRDAGPADAGSSG
jgi:hypothetical protein